MNPYVDWLMDLQEQADQVLIPWYVFDEDDTCYLCICREKVKCCSPVIDPSKLKRGIVRHWADGRFYCAEHFDSILGEPEDHL